MEGNVVFADEIIAFCLFVLIPEIVPSLVVPGYFFSPLLRRRKVADDGLEPHVESLLLEALDRHRHAPLDIAGDGAVAQSLFEIPLRQAADVGPPVGLPGHPFFQPLLKSTQLEEEVLRVPGDGGGPADAAVRLDKLGDVEGLAAGVALVAAGAGGAAGGADTFHVAVGQEALAFRAVELRYRLFIQIASLQQPQENVLGDGGVVGSASGGEEVEGDAQPLPAIEELALVVPGDGLGGLAGLLGLDGDGGAVLVGAGDHEHLVAAGAVVAGEDVRRQVAAGNLPQVQVAVGVRPGDPDEDSLAHVSVCWG